MACILKSSLLWLGRPTQESERGNRQGAMHSHSTRQPVWPDGSRGPPTPCLGGSSAP